MAYPGSRSHTWVAGEQVDHDDLNEWASKNVGWGNVAAPVQKTSAQGSITTIVDISGLSVTFTALSGRQYVAIMQVYASVTSGATAGDTLTATVANGSNGIIATGQLTFGTGFGSEAVSTPIVAPFTGSGSVTVKGRAARKSGSATWQVYGDASGNPSTLVVLDIGPTSI